MYASSSISSSLRPVSSTAIDRAPAANRSRWQCLTPADARRWCPIPPGTPGRACSSSSVNTTRTRSPGCSCSGGFDPQPRTGQLRDAALHERRRLARRQVPRRPRTVSPRPRRSHPHASSGSAGKADRPSSPCPRPPRAGNRRRLMKCTVVAVIEHQPSCRRSAPSRCRNSHADMPAVVARQPGVAGPALPAVAGSVDGKLDFVVSHHLAADDDRPCPRCGRVSSRDLPDRDVPAARLPQAHEAAGRPTRSESPASRAGGRSPPSDPRFSCGVRVRTHSRQQLDRAAVERIEPR